MASKACLASSCPGHFLSGVSIHSKRTRSSLSPNFTTMVSPSITRTNSATMHVTDIDGLRRFRGAGKVGSGASVLWATGGLVFFVGTPDEFLSYILSMEGLFDMSSSVPQMPSGPADLNSKSWGIPCSTSTV